MGDEGLMAELFDDFLSSSDASVAALSAASDALDFEGAASRAHRLRGALLSLGANRAADAAREVERIGGLVATKTPGVAAVEVVGAIRALLECLEQARLAMRQFLESRQATK